MIERKIDVEVFLVTSLLEMISSVHLYNVSAELPAASYRGSPLP